MNIFERIRASEKIRMPVLADDPVGALQIFSTLQTHVGRWRSLRGRMGSHGLFSTVMTVGGLTLLVKIVAGGKEMVVARQLGVGDALDAFLVAYSLPALAMNVIAGSFYSALVPTYIQIRESEGRAASQRLFSNVMFRGIGVLLLASVLLALLFPLVLPFFVAGFSGPKLAFTRQLFWALLPIITVTGLATTWSAVLNAEGEFALPAAAPIITSLAVVGILLFRAEAWGAWGLAAGTLAGAGLEAALIGLCLWRRGVSPMPVLGEADAGLRQVMRQYAPLAAAALVFSGTSLVDQAIAARLGPGSVAALNYGYKIVSMVIGVTAMAVSTSVLPHFSRLVANDDWNGLHRDMKSYTLLILAALIPVALLLAIFSKSLVRLIFEHGAFTSHDSQIVGHVQACFALQIPFYTIGMMYLRLISALKINTHIFLVSSVCLVLNFAFDVVFSRYFGIVGIALSTTVVSLIWSGSYYWFLLRAIPNIRSMDAYPEL